METKTEDEQNQEDADTYDALGPSAFKKRLKPEDLFVVLTEPAFDCLTDEQFRIYAILVHEQFVVNFKAGPYAKGIHDMAGRTGKSEPTVSRIFDELESMGVIRVIPNGKRATMADVLWAPKHHRHGNVTLPPKRRKTKRVKPTIDPATGKPVKRVSVRCAGFKKDGSRCGQYVTNGDYCTQWGDNPSHRTPGPPTHASSVLEPTNGSAETHAPYVSNTHSVGRGTDAGDTRDDDAIGTALKVSASDVEVKECGARAETSKMSMRIPDNVSDLLTDREPPPDDDEITDEDSRELEDWELDACPPYDGLEIIEDDWFADSEDSNADTPPLKSETYPALPSLSAPKPAKVERSWPEELALIEAEAERMAAKREGRQPAGVTA